MGILLIPKVSVLGLVKIIRVRLSGRYICMRYSENENLFSIDIGLGLS